MSSFDMTDGTNAHHEVTPGHHQLQGTLGVALSVDTRGDGDSVVPRHYCLDCVSIKHDSGFCHNGESELSRFREELGGKQLPRCVRFFKRMMTPVVYQFRFCFIIFCIKRWLQLVEKGGRCAGCHGCSADVCQQTNLADLRHFWRLFRQPQRRIFPPWFRPGPCPWPKCVLANWNMVRHVLRMVTVG